MLVIDDDKAIFETLKFGFNDEFELTFAESAEKALELMKNASPDAVIADIHLPGIDGIKLTNIIKTIDSSIPIIVISGIGDAGSIHGIVKAGADEYFGKPFDLFEMKFVLKMAVENRRKMMEESIERVSNEIESLIEASVEENIKNKTKLDTALQKFREKYIDMIASKYIADEG